MKRRLLAACLLLSAALAGAQPVAGPSAAALDARFPEPAETFASPGLQPKRQRWTDDAELAAVLRTLAGAGAAQLIEAGRTDAGSELLALRFSRGADRPAVLLVGQQHGDEPAGAEALLVLAMQLANPQHPIAAVLDRLDVLILPRANPDGAAAQRRANAALVDINRDHLLLRTREAGAIAALVARWQPLLFVDLHEYPLRADPADRADPAGRAERAVRGQDLLIGFATVANLPPALARLAEQDFGAALRQALDAAGISHEGYFTLAREGGELLARMGGAQPGRARNIAGLKNMVGVLLESRGSDLGRAHAGRRVRSHLVALHSLLRSAAGPVAELPAAVAAASAASAASAPASTVAPPPLAQQLAQIGAGVAQQACGGDWVLRTAPTRQRRQVLLLDPASGDELVFDAAWEDGRALQALATRARPCGYWLAADATEAVTRLRRLGASVRTLTAPLALQVQRYVQTSLALAAPTDARAQPPTRHVAVALEAGTLQAPAGSYYVPLDQPLANLIASALEPDTPFSWYAHHLLPRLDALQRVTLAPS